jgi:hypothetical protein
VVQLISFEFRRRKNGLEWFALPEGPWLGFNSLTSSYLGLVASFWSLPDTPAVLPRMPSHARSNHSIVDSLTALPILDLLGRTKSLRLFVVSWLIPRLGRLRGAVLQFAALRRFAVGPSDQSFDRLFRKELVGAATVNQVLLADEVEVVLAACAAHIM